MSTRCLNLAATVSSRNLQNLVTSVYRFIFIFLLLLEAIGPPGLLLSLLPSQPLGILSHPPSYGRIKANIGGGDFFESWHTPLTLLAARDEPSGHVDILE